MAVNAFWLRVEPYVDCDWRANVQRSQAPRKIFERGALWQYKEQRAICEKRSDAAWVWLTRGSSSIEKTAFRWLTIPTQSSGSRVARHEPPQ
jgi:hypothetical protein